MLLFYLVNKCSITFISWFLFSFALISSSTTSEFRFTHSCAHLFFCKYILNFIAWIVLHTFYYKNIWHILNSVVFLFAYSNNQLLPTASYLFTYRISDCFLIVFYFIHLLFMSFSLHLGQRVQQTARHILDVWTDTRSLFIFSLSPVSLGILFIYHFTRFIFSE